jgi:fatty-acyl-CoA synthase
MYIVDWLAKRSQISSNKVAVIDYHPDRRYSYRELNNRANKLANFLQSKCGVKKGSRIALLADNCIQYIDSLFAAAKIGAIWTPLNFRFAIPELEFVLSDTQPDVFICGPEYVATVKELRSKVAINHYVTLGEADMDGAWKYEAIMAESSDSPPPKEKISPEDPWAIILTGGTTGRPKGVIISHRMWTWNAINTIVSYGFRDDDIGFSVGPMFHAGIACITLPMLYLGGRAIVLSGKFDEGTILDVVEKVRPTVWLMVPTMWERLMQSPGFAHADFSSIRQVFSGGAPCPERVYEGYRARGIAFRQGYGLTEVGTNCFVPPQESHLRKTGSVGFPMFLGDMKIVDPESKEGKEVARGQTGELIIAGPHVCSGYWNNPEETKKRFLNGYFRTGDLARQDEEGYYYITGRSTYMIISGGENVYPEEVEGVLTKHPKIAQISVIGLPDKKWGEVVTAVIVPKSGQRLTEQEVIQFCRDKIAGYKIPKRVLFSDTPLPTSEVGKILRRVVKETVMQKEARS